MASFKVCVVIALACVIAACSAEENKRVERFVYPYGGVGFGAAVALPVASYSAGLPVASYSAGLPVTSYSAALPVASYSAALPVAKTIIPSVAAPAITSFAAPAITSYAAPAITSYAAAPAVAHVAAPVVSSPLVSSFGYSGIAASYSSLGLGSTLLKK